MKDFQGKTAVVTGGASGIGLALAERFASERMNVVLADIEEDALDKAVADMQGRQHQVKGVVTDAMRRESIENLLAETVAEYGNVHILCNNAGVASLTRNVAGVWDIPDADWQWVMGVNFWGVLYGLQVFVPHMLAHGEPGHIVNTASLAGLLPGGGPYGVSKHGVLVLSEGLCNDLRNAGADIGASVLCPGFVNTNIHAAERNRPSEFSAAAHTLPESTELKAMLQAGMEPADVANEVFRAIEENRLYVLPHPAWDELVRARVDAVLARGGPPNFAQELAGRRDRGDKL